MVVLLLIFKGTSILFSIVTAPSYISFNSIRGFPFLQVLPNFVYILLDGSYSDRYGVTSCCGFECISLVISDADHLFMRLLAV